MTTHREAAQRIADLLAESYPGEEAAVGLFDEGGGRWSVAVHFGVPPDEAALRALVALVAGPAAGEALRFERLADKNWVAASLAGLAPVAAGRFMVHGAHDRARVPVNRIGIEIEAALAFGTGHHGTTRGCLIALDAILKAPPRPRRVLDLGTGSGVLAIAAARALRRRVLASDLDATAMRAARGNARRNRAGMLVEAIQADGVAHRRIRERAPFDLVFANILLGPLKRLAMPLTRLVAPGGRVVLSGLLAAQASAARSAYRGLALHRRIDLDGWTTLVLVRRPARRQASRIARVPAGQ